MVVCLSVVDSLQGCDLVMDFEGSELYVASKISIFGTIYKVNLFLATGMGNDIPQFSKITSIIVQGRTSNDVHFVVEKYSTKRFAVHFHANEISQMESPIYFVINSSQLLDHLPLSVLRTYEHNSPCYVTPRYALTQIHH